MPEAADLLEEIATLKTMLIASEAHNLCKDKRTERLEKLAAALRHAPFGRRSERSDPDQFELAPEDLEAAITAIHPEDDAGDRDANRGSRPKHLSRTEEVIKPGRLISACGSGRHRIGEDVSERLGIVSAQFRVDITRRPKYACRSCTDGVTQARTSRRLISGGRPTEATVAHVLVSKYADHLPPYRQARVYSGQSVDPD